MLKFNSKKKHPWNAEAPTDLQLSTWSRPLLGSERETDVDERAVRPAESLETSVHSHPDTDRDPALPEQERRPSEEGDVPRRRLSPRLLQLGVPVEHQPRSDVEEEPLGQSDLGQGEPTEAPVPQNRSDVGVELQHQTDVLVRLEPSSHPQEDVSDDRRAVRDGELSQPSDVDGGRGLRAQVISPPTVVSQGSCGYGHGRTEDQHQQSNHLQLLAYTSMTCWCQLRIMDRPFKSSYFFFVPHTYQK